MLVGERDREASMSQTMAKKHSVAWLGNQISQATCIHEMYFKWGSQAEEAAWEVWTTLKVRKGHQGSKHKQARGTEPEELGRDMGPELS